MGLYGDPVGMLWGSYGAAMGMLWGCYGDAMGQLWGSYGAAMGMLWGSYGDAMGMLWGSYGDAMGQLWGSYGDAMGMLWGSCVQRAPHPSAPGGHAGGRAVPGTYGAAMGQLWGSYGAAMGQLWGCYGAAMGQLWGCYGAAMGMLWGSYGDAMGMLWGCYGAAMGLLWGCYGDAMGMLWGSWCPMRPTSQCTWGPCRRPCSSRHLWGSYGAAMGMLWGCYGDAMGMLWGCYGAAMGQLWGSYGAAMGMLWGCYGDAMGQLWGSYGDAMGQLWGSYGAAMGQLWGSYGDAMGLLWGSYGAAMGQLWGCYGAAMGMLWGSYGAAMGMLWGCYGDAMGQLCPTRPTSQCTWGPCRRPCSSRHLWGSYGAAMGQLWGSYGDAMGMLWGCYGAAMGMLWGSYGDAMGMLWGCYGAAMGMLWGCNGDAMGQLWGSYGAAMGQLWGCYGAAMGQLWGSYGDAMGMLWGCYGAAMGQLWGSYGAAMGQLWGCYGDAMGMLWGSYGAAMGILWGCYGDAMGMLWGSYGDAMGMLWGSYGDAMGQLWGSYGAAMGMLWGCYGDPMGMLWGSYGSLCVSMGQVTSDPTSPPQLRTLGDDLQDGDVILSNHPSAGGSHLPDLTVITPVFISGTPSPVFFVANRGHHADIGGITPGSMPPHSQSLLEEGATFLSFKLVRNGTFQEEAVSAALLAPGSIPGCSGARSLQDNLSDLRAQAAANRAGAELVMELIRTHGLSCVQGYMQHLQDTAERCVRDLLRGFWSRWGPELEAEDSMDDGTPLRLRVTLNPQGSAVFDFTGTGPQVLGNWNAPRAVTLAAIIYCLRCMVGQDLPLNQGCLAPIRVLIPQGSILAPHPEAAVVGGNVLTSQRVVDVILKAFGVCAASQGCMNNVTFGSAHWGYYETVGGGAGAGPGWRGRSGVQSHMTNTRITDPEILELRFPVHLQSFGLRLGSGGSGYWSGGDGVIRELRFRERLKLMVLSERRVLRPYGLCGGSPGALGLNLLIRRDGRTINLGGKNTVNVEPGDVFRLLTPGGGGFGAPQEGEGQGEGQGEGEGPSQPLPPPKSFTERGSVFEYRSLQESV
uniref:Uncharacterized protein n=1 Tax=Melopsittacus undulatus TaxID=13146 RepID=A0A8V5GWG0_MELUD